MEKVVVFGMRYAASPIAYLRDLLTTNPRARARGHPNIKAFLVNTWWWSMLYEGLVPLAEINQDDESQLIKKCAGDWAWAVSQVLERDPPEGNKHISNRVFWDIVSLGKLDIAKGGARALRSAIAGRRTNLVRELLVQGGPRMGDPIYDQIFIAAIDPHHAEANKILEMLIHIPEAREAGWEAAMNMALEKDRMSAFEDNPFIRQAIDMLIRHVEPDFIGASTFLKLGMHFERWSEPFRSTQITALFDRVGASKLLDLAKEWNKDRNYDCRTGLGILRSLRCFGLDLPSFGFDEVLHLVQDKCPAHFDLIFELAASDPQKLQRATVAFLLTREQYTSFLLSSLIISPFGEVLNHLSRNNKWMAILHKGVRVDDPRTGGTRELTPRLLTYVMMENGLSTFLENAICAFLPERARVENVGPEGWQRVPVIKGMCDGMADWMGEHSAEECDSAKQDIVKLVTTLYTHYGLKRLRPVYFCKMASRKNVDVSRFWKPARVLWNQSGTLLEKTIRWGWRVLMMMSKQLGEMQRRDELMETVEVLGGFLQECKQISQEEDESLTMFVESIVERLEKFRRPTGLPIRFIDSAISLGLPRLSQVYGVAFVFETLGIAIARHVDVATQAEPYRFSFIYPGRNEPGRHVFAGPERKRAVPRWATLMSLLAVPPSSYDKAQTQRLQNFLCGVSSHILAMRSADERAEFVAVALPALHRHISEVLAIANPDTSLTPALGKLFAAAQHRGIDELYSMFQDATQPTEAVSGAFQGPAIFNIKWALPPASLDPPHLLELPP
ncbi:hypothetical protein HDU89_007811 [Geranomyces variabilis]|nr:hypothetical protein HDU89_007811 [Geranomyces variabilis]